MTAVVLALAAPGQGVIVGGGGKAATDCLTVFSSASINYPAAKPRNIRCTDGDPCDNDGVVNGVCEFPILVCANSTFDARCTLNGVESVTVAHADDDGIDKKFDTEFQAVQMSIDGAITDSQTDQTTADNCTTTRLIHVRVNGPVKGRTGNNVCTSKAKTLRLSTTSLPVAGVRTLDSDVLWMTCLPAKTDPNGCNPQTFFNGTFDRIQQQILTQSCATATCHDGTKQSGLLLETGSAYTNLVNVDPVNAAAVSANWKRVVPGDSAHSYLFHKVEGDFHNTLLTNFGVRMPKGKPKLHHTLRDVIRLWIDNGAPNDNTWVPGTD